MFCPLAVLIYLCVYKYKKGFQCSSSVERKGYCILLIGRSLGSTFFREFFRKYVLGGSFKIGKIGKACQIGKLGKVFSIRGQDGTFGLVCFDLQYCVKIRLYKLGCKCK